MTDFGLSVLWIFAMLRELTVDLRGSAIRFWDSMESRRELNRLKNTLRGNSFDYVINKFIFLFLLKLRIS